jgi:NDP-sugar pyrophosphorylase family protein
MFAPDEEKKKPKPIILIPLGGLGQRFADVGYSEPKPLIKALGDPILYWLLKSLNLSPDKVRMVLVPYHPDLARHRFEDRLRKDFPKVPFRFMPLAGNTRGAADTLRIALESLDPDTTPDSPIISLDADNFYTLDVLDLWDGRDCLVTFEDFGNQPAYSYVRVGVEARIVEIREKVRISNLACTGAYGFSSWRRLLHYCSKTLSDEKYMQKNEFYISSVIALMLEDPSIHFEPVIVPRDAFVCLGTPLQLRAFCNDVPRQDARDGQIKITPRRFCFDLDNTLVTFPRVAGDYSTVEPIPYMINYVQYLKRFDHVIIIYTARRMLTHKGNVSAAIADIGRITFETLHKFEIPYDEICFGKPVADHYIDDLGVSSYSDVEKALGFYENEVKPRVFNEISRPSSLQLIRKKSNDDAGSLQGEIYYYNHIPVSIKDCFPIMVGYDENQRWYDVERISGSNTSNLLLSQELTKSALSSIMGTLHRIHGANYVLEEEEIFLYANYSKKLRKRYQEYPGYSNFPDSDMVFASLVEQLDDYESKGRGRCAVIHGDPVMSNIIINTFGKVKLIDMRGKIGETFSIRGDEVYDWAKLYQSLIGYDEILQGRQITEGYRQDLLKCFWENLKKMSPELSPEDVKLVTRSLLFSLLPLHTAADEAEKQQGYYRLIEKCTK